MELKELDFEIINELKKDPFILHNVLATKLNVAHKTITNHMDALIENKFIIPSVIVNPEQFGFKNRVDIFVWVNNSSDNQFHEFLNEYRTNIVYFATHFEGDNYSIQGVFKSFDDLSQFLNRIKKLSFVEKTEYAIVSNVYFDVDSWLPEEK
jgi:DNA-binding Lrp family transcriptional regulator